MAALAPVGDNVTVVVICVGCVHTSTVLTDGVVGKPVLAQRMLPELVEYLPYFRGLFKGCSYVIIVNSSFVHFLPGFHFELYSKVVHCFEEWFFEVFHEVGAAALWAGYLGVWNTKVLLIRLWEGIWYLSEGVVVVCNPDGPCRCPKLSEGFAHSVCYENVT